MLRGMLRLVGISEWRRASLAKMVTLKYQIKALESVKLIVKGYLIGGGELKIRGLVLNVAQGLVYQLLRRLLAPTVAPSKL